ncbi:hypothetical protein WN51_12471 [Melipona quadrifasciata]|uniref:Uncharacterized protein n=1 Tax=Melipona quadrifasciata TaxID=166423 RepID=A0A0N0BHU6_9HYME|nr:hypothetical protein WN51_12471 [Melipona quadrifasciata]
MDPPDLDPLDLLTEHLYVMFHTVTGKNYSALFQNFKEKPEVYFPGEWSEFRLRTIEEASLHRALSKILKNLLLGTRYSLDYIDYAWKPETLKSRNFPTKGEPKSKGANLRHGTPKKHRESTERVSICKYPLYRNVWGDPECRMEYHQSFQLEIVGVGAHKQTSMTLLQVFDFTLSATLQCAFARASSNAKFVLLASFTMREPRKGSWLANRKQGAIPGVIPAHLTIAVRFQSRDSQACIIASPIALSYYVDKYSNSVDVACPAGSSA